MEITRSAAGIFFSYGKIRDDKLMLSDVDAVVILMLISALTGLGFKQTASSTYTLLARE